MTINIKQVSHDLTPIVKSICIMGQEMDTIFHKLYTLLEPIDPKQRKFFENLASGLQALNSSSDLARQYLEEIDAEANRNGIQKSY